MSKALSTTKVDWAPWPTFKEEHIQAVASVLASGRVNQWTGEEVWAFEREYAAYLDRKHAVAVMNGTSALELALKAFGIGPGDEVITTPRSFIASASSVVLQGAVPVFADVDRESGNLTPATIKDVIGPKTKAIIVVHIAGWPADMEGIMAIADAQGLIVIEDCAQAHGARVNGRPVGSFGHVAAFSFCQDKIITTGGEGGLIALDDDEAWNTAWSYKDHGKSYSAVFEREHPFGFRWLHESFGTNWRMTEMQAALGRVQLRELEESVRIRNENASLFRERLNSVPGLRVPTVDAADVHAYYRLYAYVIPEALAPGWNRDRIQEEILEAGIPVSSGSASEMYREVAFTESGLAPTEPLPVAHELGETSLAFTVHPGLTREAILGAGELVAGVFARAVR
jgi:dTDP-4-amino-4,6-dideoxygalactose transaminase